MSLAVSARLGGRRAKLKVGRRAAVDGDPGLVEGVVVSDVMAAFRDRLVHRVRIVYVLGRLARVASLWVLLLSLVGGCVMGRVPEPRLVVGLVTKTDTNPFFVTIREAAVSRADQLGVELRAFSGNFDGDWETQVEAVENLVAGGVAGILITPSDPDALTDAVRKAREVGVLVIALDTPFNLPGSVDATFATDNFRAGELIGVWARARTDLLWADVRIVTLDGSEAQITVDVLRNQGFLSGFGMDIKDPTRMYDEDDPRIVGHGATMGTAAGGRAVMENLIRQNPGINLVYTVNEPAAAGAYMALEDASKENDVLVVSIDGSCEGVGRVASGEIDATSMQYPHRMALLGIDAIVEHSKTGIKPENMSDLGFYDTGVTLVTQHPTTAIPSITPKQALNECW